MQFKCQIKKLNLHTLFAKILIYYLFIELKYMFFIHNFNIKKSYCVELIAISLYKLSKKSKFQYLF